MSLFNDLDDYKLHTEFCTNSNIILHRSYRADWAHGRSRVVVQEEWTPQKPPLGVGQFGVIRLEERLTSDGDTFPEHKQRAVKQLRKIDLERMRVDFRKELQALTKFSRSKFAQSQAFVEFFGWFEDDDHIYLAMEYFQNGTLDHYITKGISEHDAQIIGQQLLEGLRIMHQENFTHRDLKPQNIFVVQQSPYWWVKIGDFGISKRAAKDDTMLRTSTGTPLYLAPEVLHYLPYQDEETDAYTNAVDIWSFACVSYEMLALQVPFPDWPRNLVTFCHGAPFPDGPLINRVSAMSIDLIRSVLVSAPEKRPTAREALGAAWFQMAVSDGRVEPTTHTTEHGSFDTNQKTMTYKSSMGTNSLTIRQHKRGRYITSIGSNQPDPSAQVPRAMSCSSSTILPDTGSMSNDDTHTSDDEVALTVKSKEGEESDMLYSTSDIKGEKLYPFGCNICDRLVTGYHYYCSICNVSICMRCETLGRHCASQDHWIAKGQVVDEKITHFNTQVIRTGWSLVRIDGKEDDHFRFTLPSQRRRWTKSYKRLKATEAPYDYCFQCGCTFPNDDPPNRHVWELHGTIEVSMEVVPAKTEPAESTIVWVKEPTPEEQKLHDEKMKRMENEMQAVLQAKVSEKESKLKQSEEELYMRHRELKDQLERQYDALQERLSKSQDKKKKKRFQLL